MCLRKCKVTFMLMGVNAEADVGEFIAFEFFPILLNVYVR